MTDSPTTSGQVPDMHVELASGAAMPLLGFGTWQLKGPDAVRATRTALEVGYRHLDTATVYDNEAEVGSALQDSGVSRADVFITTKFPPNRAGNELTTLRASLDLLQSEYVDLWLIHWTPSHGVGSDIWEAFVEAREQKLVRDIGVSNYSVDQLDQLASDTGVTPAVNQIEWSPKLFDAGLVKEHRARGIALEGYSGLRGGVLGHPAVADVARRTGRTPAQVVIRWHLQHDIITIPKSSQPDRIAANADVGGFELSDDDMATLDAVSSSP